jgi:oligopeptide/dipeptide ABC transporter ATP-binding protein
MSVLVEVKDLKKHFPVRGGFFERTRKKVHAVDGISFRIGETDSFGLVGESGSGKSTTAKLLLKLLEPTSGQIKVFGQDISELSKHDLKQLRRGVQMIFQDPMASLNPRKTVCHILSQPMLCHNIVKRDEARGKVLELLEKVGFSPPEAYVDRYPHEFSGGQRQRIVIARAIAVKPKFIVADEPVSALDMSIRANILNLMKDLQREFDMTYLIIAHDLTVIRFMCTRVAIMYLGKIVELAEAEELYTTPLHPYTASLISATPIPDPKKSRSRNQIIIKGEVPSPINLPPGCRFHTRCLQVQPKCLTTEPELVSATDNHLVACHMANRR